MKKQLFALVGLGLLLSAASAVAQTPMVKATIPFRFIVNKATMPAGEYTILALGPSDRQLLVASPDWKFKQLVLAFPVDPFTDSQHSKLVFHRYGDRYFLSQIWIQGRPYGAQLPRSSQEVEMALDYPVHQVVLIARAH